MRNEHITLEPEPFPHMLVSAFLPQERADAMLSWLENSARWRFQQTSFYQQFSCSNIADALLEDGSPILETPFLHELRTRMETAFDVQLDPNKMYVCSHRLIRGTGIGIHTDRPGDGRETHRLVAHFTRDYVDSQGGHLMFFAEKSMSALSRIIRPLHNSAAAFELSERSFHAVNDITDGARYSLVFSFWRMGVEADVSSQPDPFKRDFPSEISLPTGNAVGNSAITLLRRLGAHTVPHSGRTLLDHLVGTAQILAAWSAPEDTVTAGLAHSIYGTPGFPLAVAAFTERERVRAALGERAEELAFRFATGAVDDEACRLIALANAVEQRGNPQPEPGEDEEILAMLEHQRNILSEDIRADVLRRLTSVGVPEAVR